MDWEIVKELALVLLGLVLALGFHWLRYYLTKGDMEHSREYWQRVRERSRIRHARSKARARGGKGTPVRLRPRGLEEDEAFEHMQRIHRRLREEIQKCRKEEGQ